MKLSDLEHPQIVHKTRDIGPRITHVRGEESHDEYRGMKVYQFEMNAFECDVARAAIRMLHKHHDFFYRMELSTEASVGIVMESLIVEGIERIKSTEKMMEEMQHEQML